MNLSSTDFNITFISYINKRKHFESIHPLKKSLTNIQINKSLTIQGKKNHTHLNAHKLYHTRIKER